MALWSCHLIYFTGDFQWISIVVDKIKHVHKSVDLSSTAVKRAYGLGIFMLVYATGLHFLVYYSVTLLIPVIMWLMNERKPIALVIIPL